MDNLPVREMVLYKHGVGFFRREGETDAENVSLTFRQDEINDVLKSLTVFDRNGGQIRGIHYQTPMDHAARLANSSIRLSDHHSLTDLLRDLRGRQLELTLEGEIIQGRLVGVDIEEEEKLHRSTVSLVGKADGQVHVFRLEGLRGLRILDGQADHDLHYFLDTSMSEDVRRGVTVRLDPGDHQLVVYYVAPSPTWRVSYRLVAESDQGGSEQGRALLQGWGLFDNRLDEDLQDVNVTLVAGQPISFIYELYASRIPKRPTVEDETRIAPGPVEFAAGEYMSEEKERGISRDMPLLAKAAAPGRALASMAAPAPTGGMSMDDLQAGTPAQAEAKAAGEFFQYVVTTPVSVKRGESALVPIINSDLSYSKELLYNRAKLPDHPVAAIRFDNQTGLTLERGPVTVVEDGDYKGEAVVPFTKTDNEVYLPYAVELGVRVTERYKHQTQMAGLNIREKFLIIQEYQVEQVTYLLENTTDRDLTITIEAPIRQTFELFDTPDPDVVTASERRWRVVVSPHSKAKFIRQERHLSRRRSEVRHLDYRLLDRYFKDRWLDEATYQQLSGLLDNLALIENARAEQAALLDERGTIYERQEQLRKNLSALKSEGEEAALRSRMLTQLEASEDRLAVVDARDAELDTLIEQAETAIDQTLSELGSDN